MRAIMAGYGYLGEKIAALLAQTGYALTVVRRSAEPAGPFELLRHDLATTALPDQTDAFDAAVFCLAPHARQSDEYRSTYCTAQQHFLAGIRATSYVYISSTAVYPDGAGVYRESDAQPHSERAAILLEAEAIALAQPGGCVLRLAGLYSADRPIYRTGRTSYGEDKLVHFVHRDDAARAVLHSVRNRLTGIYNVHDGNPLWRSDILRALGQDAPAGNHAAARRIVAEKFMHAGFAPLFSDYFTGTKFAEST